MDKNRNILFFRVVKPNLNPRPERERESGDEEVFAEMDEWAILLPFAKGEAGFEGAFLPLYSWETEKIPSLTVSEGKKRDGKPVPYVTGWISEAGAASLCASVPLLMQLHAEKHVMKNNVFKVN